MGTVPTPPTYVTGTVLTAALLNQLGAVQSFILSPPQCEAYHSSAVSVPNGGTFTVIPLQSEAFDVVQSGDQPMHDNTTNNSRIYFRTPGKYEISGQLSFAVNGTNRRIVQIRSNAAGLDSIGNLLLYTTQGALASSQTAVPIPKFPFVASVGDYIEMFGFQDSGGSLATIAGASASFLWARFISQ